MSDLPVVESLALQQQPSTSGDGTEALPISPIEWAAVGAFLAAVLVASISSVRQGWSPIADEALMELRVRDIPAHIPLVGVYSRYGWSHPGPIQFYLLWVFYKLGRSSSSALLVGSLSLHATWSLLAWWAARSIDRIAGMLVLAGSVVILASTSPSIVRTPWNPFVILVGGMAVIALGWALSQRLVIGGFALFPVASVMVQSHVVTAPMVVFVVVASLAIMTILPDAGVPIPWRAVGIGTVVAVAVWIPPIVQQLAGDSGNVTAILRRGGDGETAGLRDAAGVLTGSFAAWPSVIRPTKVDEILVHTAMSVPVWLLLPIVGAVLAWRGRRQRLNAAYLRGLAICFAALVGVTVSIAATTGLLANYLVVATRPAAVITMIMGLAAILNYFGISCRALTLRLTGALVICLSVVIGVVQLGAQNPSADFRPTVEALQGAVEANATSNPISVQAWPGSRPWAISIALMLQLERDGYEIAATDLDATYVGSDRAGSRPGFSVIVATIAAKDELIEDGWTILDIYQPLSTKDQNALRRLEAERRTWASHDDTAAAVDNAAVFARPLEFEKSVAAIEKGRVPMLVAARTID